MRKAKPRWKGEGHRATTESALPRITNSGTQESTTSKNKATKVFLTAKGETNKMSDLPNIKRLIYKKRELVY